jgi:predicted nucleotidyltransferase
MARLIAHFVLHPQQSMHFRALQRHTTLPHRSLQTELGRLEALGVVTRRQDGRHVTFTAKAEAPVWRALRQVVRHVADPAELLRDALADATGIDAAFVYGSTARGDARPDSDVDLFVIGSFGDTTDLAARTMEVSALLQREVNVSRYAVAELRDRVRSGSPFLKRVMAAPKRWVVGGPGALRRIAA